MALKKNEFDTLDDLMYEVFEELLKLPFEIKSSRGISSEIVGTALVLKNPRARISRTETRGKAFSALGELLWYLSKDNSLKFIEHYIPNYKEESEDGITIYGGYGPRLFKLNGKLDQIQTVINLLTEKSTTRRAVIQIFDGEDLNGNHKEIPCTTTLQFLVRDNKLSMVTSMRSNDAFLGLPHDLFAFTMIQEIIAKSLNLNLGDYIHIPGSLHLYEKDRVKCEEYLQEGYQSTTIQMPEMPNGNPFPAIEQLLKAESEIRIPSKIDIKEYDLDNYWLDLIRLLNIHHYLHMEEPEDVEMIRNELSNQIYNPYIDKRLVTLRQILEKRND